MPELLNFSFPAGWYFLNCDNTELKRSSKSTFFCFRTASLEGKGLNRQIRFLTGYRILTENSLSDNKLKRRLADLPPIWFLGYVKGDDAEVF